MYQNRSTYVKYMLLMFFFFLFVAAAPVGEDVSRWIKYLKAKIQILCPYPRSVSVPITWWSKS